MNVSFSKTGEGSTPVESSAAPAQNTNLPAVQERQELPVGAKQSMLSEIVVPWLNLVHSTGLLKDSFTPGSYVHDQSLTLYTPAAVNAKNSKVDREGTPPLIVTFLDLRPTCYREKVKGGAPGLVAYSLEEVAKLGGSTDYKEWELKQASGMKRFVYSRDCLLAIERPEFVADDDSVFVFPVGDKKYALAMFRMKGASHTVLKRTILTHQHIGCLRKGTATHSYALGSTLAPTPDKSSTYWNPTLTPHKPSTEAFMDFARKVLETPQTEAADDGAE